MRVDRWCIRRLSHARATSVVCLCGVFIGTGLAAPAPASVPAQSTFEVRLLTTVSSYRSKPGDEVRAKVVASICPGAKAGLPDGAIIRGVVKSVRRVGLGIIHETARIDLEFNRVELADGETASLDARIVSVDNAREHVDRQGRIRGIRATSSLSNRLAERIALELLEHPMGLIPLFLVESSVLRFPDPEILYLPGTELEISLKKDLAIAAGGACEMPPSELARSTELEQIVAGLPYWSFSERGHKPMDPANLLFIGDGGAVGRAFAAAGWTDSRSLSAITGLGVIRAIAEDHGDADAPMRRLLFEGRLPDMYRQKGLNDFEKRHHIRVWKRTGEFQAAPIWAAAATRDIAATFSFRFGFTHKIETDLDLERDKVVSDFVSAGCVDEVAYIGRPPGVVAKEGWLRKGLSTDGRVAVLVLNSCETLPPAGMVSKDLEPRLAVRCVRRVTLTVRNHFLRDNLAWRGGEGALLAFRAARAWQRERGAARQAAAFGKQSPAPNTAWIVAPSCDKAAVATRARHAARRGPV